MLLVVLVISAWPQNSTLGVRLLIASAAEFAFVGGVLWRPAGQPAR